MSIDMETRVAQYVQLRDTIKEKDDAHKAALAPYRTALENLNGLILQHLNSIGGDSISTAAGTAYKTVKKSASVADMDVFWKHIVSTGDFDLIDKKANVSAVEAYVEEHKQLPPGVNFTTTSVVGVRRPSK